MSSDKLNVGSYKFLSSVSLLRPHVSQRIFCLVDKLDILLDLLNRTTTLGRNPLRFIEEYPSEHGNRASTSSSYLRQQANKNPR